MVFKPEITLGTIIEIITLLGIVFGAIHKFSVIETKLNIIFNWWSTRVVGREETSHQRDQRRQFFGEEGEQ